MFDLIKEIGGVHQRKSEAGDGVLREKFIDVAADEIGTAQPAGLYGKTFGFEPFLQERDLRGAAGTVHAFDDDEAAGDFVRIETDERFAEKGLSRIFFRLRGDRLRGDGRLRLCSNRGFFQGLRGFRLRLLFRRFACVHKMALCPSRSNKHRAELLEEHYSISRTSNSKKDGTGGSNGPPPGAVHQRDEND